MHQTKAESNRWVTQEKEAGAEKTWTENMKVKIIN